MMFPGNIWTKSSEVSGVRSISAFPSVRARHKRDGACGDRHSTPQYLETRFEEISRSNRHRPFRAPAGGRRSNAAINDDCFGHFKPASFISSPQRCNSRLESLDALEFLEEERACFLSKEVDLQQFQWSKVLLFFQRLGTPDDCAQWLKSALFCTVEEEIRD
jgi:hypothetical protein